jgi:hypothetical protein
MLSPQRRSLGVDYLQASLQKMVRRDLIRHGRYCEPAIIALAIFRALSKIFALHLFRYSQILLFDLFGHPQACLNLL